MKEIPFLNLVHWQNKKQDRKRKKRWDMESWTLNLEIKKRMWLDVCERERWRGNENSEAEVPLLMRDTD